MEGVLRAIILAVLIFSTFSCNDKVENIKIYSIRYGDSLFGKQFTHYGYRGNEKVPFSWKFYLVEYGGKRILIDTGFKNEKLRKLFQIKNYVDPVKILRDNGFSPQSIDYVILTHCHFDHAGNAHHFPNAKFIMNRLTYRKILKDPKRHKLRKLLKEGKNLTLFTKEFKLMEIFTVKWIGGHTAGSSIVLLNKGKLRYCFAGDEAYLLENIEKGIGSASIVNHRRNMGFIKFMQGGEYMPLLFHQPDTWKERFRQVPVTSTFKQTAK